LNTVGEKYMFENKTIFKTAYQQKVVQECGREVTEASLVQKYLSLGNMVREYMSINAMSTKENPKYKGSKKMYYFSLEFLIGRLLTNNLMNLGIYEVVRDGLDELGVDVNQLEDLETDAGLGNGGLGRLAACFLDSMAYLNIPGNGNTIRYEYGLFKQKIVDGYQVEVPDQWLKYGNVWEVRKPTQAIEVKFWGRIESKRCNGGKLCFTHVNSQNVLAVPYDVPIVGGHTSMTNSLRLWSAEASENIRSDIDFRTYLNEIKQICLNVYPDDSTEEGRYLRLKQEYFFTCAGINSIINSYLKEGNKILDLGEKIAIQLNDTHPAMGIAELMRILMDIHNLDWDQAWSITNKVMAYTNHTVLPEALEKWPIKMVSNLLPRIYMIIQEINIRFKREVQNKFPNDRDLWERVTIIDRDQVKMAHLAIVGAHKVNGVAKLHTEILMNENFKDFVKIYPNKFINMTNGITQRRWFLYSNPQLRSMCEDLLKCDLSLDFDKIEGLINFIDDKKVQEDFLQIKHERKIVLRDFLRKEYNIELDVNSIFDVQAKRLHAYKRQTLNILHIIYLFNKIHNDPSFTMPKTTFIFGAKAAPSYTFAKQIIKLINDVSVKIHNDPLVSKFIDVVFIPNYRVTVAEKLMNATDISEQISTAGLEASGTGNMKFMMNGALTLGTLDGANVEIDALVGREHDIIFGLNTEEVNSMRGYYNSYEIYSSDNDVREAMDSLVNGTWNSNLDEYRLIYDELVNHGDQYFVFADFKAYVEAHEIANKKYINKYKWAKSCLVNIAKSAYFSSDRTISSYAKEIWEIDPIKL
jgi:starch phosphorylase